MGSGVSSISRQCRWGPETLTATCSSDGAWTPPVLTGLTARRLHSCSSRKVTSSGPARTLLQNSWSEDRCLDFTLETVLKPPSSPFCSHLYTNGARGTMNSFCPEYTKACHFSQVTHVPDQVTVTGYNSVCAKVVQNLCVSETVLVSPKASPS